MSSSLKEKLKQEGKLSSGKGRSIVNITDITAYIDKNITEILTLNSLADKFGISKSYLSHLFKARLGLSVFHYIKLKKLGLAKEYYQSGLSLTQAAMKAGFSDYTTFYKAYRSEYGSSPTKHTLK